MRASYHPRRSGWVVGGGIVFWVVIGWIALPVIVLGWLLYFCHWLVARYGWPRSITVLLTFVLFFYLLGALS